MTRILIVEDQPAVAAALGVLFEVHGLPASIACGPEEALRALAAGGVGMVVQDMNFTPGHTGGEEGIELFRALRRREPALPILLLTAWTSLETAITLVKEGAEDYLPKPWDDDRLVAVVRALLERRERELSGARRRAGLERQRAELAAAHDLCGAVWSSERTHQLIVRALQVARSDAPVLITGPSGAGKEKIAEILHHNSDRARRPLVRVNAGALPEALLESELFGSEAGAFTGAARLRVGRFEAADGGTLFLDEIGNLPPAGQIKLLRVLQQGEFERLGSSVTRRVNVRVLCATNADLLRDLAAGRFREDLYYRLNVFELRVPALVDRIEDVPALAEQFLASVSPPPGHDGWRLGLAAHELLLRQPWPGNVRELQNALRRATLVAEGGTIEPGDLGLSEVVAPTGGSEGTNAQRAAQSEAEPLMLAERIALERALEQSGGVVSQAAEALGLSRQALYRRLEKHGLTLERRVRGEH